MNRNTLLAVTAVLLTASLSPLTQAANYRAKGGAWGTSKSWSPERVPNGLDDGIFYEAASGITTTVNSDKNYTLNGLATFVNGNGALTVVAGNAFSSLTFESTNGPATICYKNNASQSTALTVDVPLVLASDLQIVNDAHPNNNKNKQIHIKENISGTGNILSTMYGSGGTGTLAINFGNVSNIGSFTVGTSDSLVTNVAGKTIRAGLSNTGPTTVNGILACTEGVFVTSGTLNLTGANTYTGGTSISGGRLNVSGDGTLGLGTVTVEAAGSLSIQTHAVIADTAMLSVTKGTYPNIILAEGVNDRVGALVLNGIPCLAGGTYGSTASGAKHVFNEYFSGKGVISIVGKPEPTLMALHAQRKPVVIDPGTAPRIAVWDPIKSTHAAKFDVDAEYLTHVASVLGANGVAVTRVTTEQVADPAVFNANVFDALFTDGGGVPESNFTAYQTFANAGGVLVALQGSASDHQQAFGVKIVQKADKTWSLFPPSGGGYPWQTETLYDLLGINFRYQIDMAYGGVSHTPMPLLTNYMTNAPTLIKPLSSRWFTPKDGGTFYPLIRSQFANEDDYTPQAFLAVAGNGKAKGIFVGSPSLTNGTDDEWKKSNDLLVALAKLCADLRHERLNLAGFETVSPVTSVVKAGPLQIRPPGVGVNPEGATALLRWGKFDGARAEFGTSLAAGQSKILNPGDPTLSFPASIASGATLTLNLPANAVLPQTTKTYLRVRGAYANRNVGLKVSVGEHVLWNELFVARTSVGVVDQGNRYDNIPYEFTRIIFLPPIAAGDSIVLSNPGEDALWFDAVQVEQPSRPAPTRGIGLHSSVSLAFSNPCALTPEIVEDWTWMRCTSRPHFIGEPNAPDRWNKYDKMIQAYCRLTPHVQLILEGAPSWTVTDKERLNANPDRKQMTPPDNALYAGLVEEIVTKYRDQVEDWEIWNEQNIKYFWLGDADEYAALFKTVAPIIRRLDPTAKVIIGGHAGTTTASLDPWVSAAVANGLTTDADLFGFHAYAPNGVFDLPYGLFEGHLMNRGGEIEIYPNEQGYEYDKIGETAQGNYSNVGLARLLANGVSKVTLFNGGGDGHGYGVIDGQGNPRPAYAPIHDYMMLAKDGARRLDVAMTGPEGTPLRGVYCAASVDTNGTSMVLLNPADTPAMQLPKSIIEGFNSNADIMKWDVFYGSKKEEGGKAIIERSEGQNYVGFFKKMNLDPDLLPIIEVDVPECEGKYHLYLKWPDNGKIIQVVKDGGVGTVSVNYAEMFAPKGEQLVEVLFRLYGARMAIDELRFPAQPAPDAESIPVRLLLPSTGTGTPVATATEDGNTVPVSVSRMGTGEAATLELLLNITGRTRVQINEN